MSFFWEKYRFNSYTIILRQKTACPRRSGGGQKQCLWKQTRSHIPGERECVSSHTLPNQLAVSQGRERWVSRRPRLRWTLHERQPFCLHLSDGLSFHASARTSIVLPLTERYTQHLHNTHIIHTHTRDNIWNIECVVKQATCVSDNGCIILPQENQVKEVFNHLFCKHVEVDQKLFNS